MAIIQSRYEVDIPQRDGRCYVTEWHTTDTGETFRIDYGPVDVAAVDCDAVMRARVTVLNATPADQLPAEA